MKRLKTSRKTMLGMTIAFVCLLFFISSANAIYVGPQSYDLYAGAVYSGDLESVLYNDDDTLDIQAKRTWVFLYHFEIHIHFNMEVGQYEKIKVLYQAH